MEKKDYIINVCDYTITKGISIEEYYLSLAEKIRSGEKLNLMKWELENPFLTSNDIKLLIDSSDPDICLYFAKTMDRVIELNLQQYKKSEALAVRENNNSLVPVQQQVETTEDLTREGIEEVIDEKMPTEEKNETTEDLTREEIEEVIDEKMPTEEKNETTEDLTREEIEEVIDEKMPTQNEKDVESNTLTRKEDSTKEFSPIRIIITKISRKIGELLNGFAIVRESKTGRTDIYYHDAKKDSLSGKTTIYNNELNVESGYYINFDEYIIELMNQILEENKEATTIRFVRDDGKEKSPLEVAEEAFAIARKEGALRFGNEINHADIKTYQDLLNLNLNSEEEYYDEKLKTGFYVRRDVLARIFDRYTVKANVVLNDEEKVKKGIKK